nr:MAG TPA: portal protein [Caudoviricetes sp.]
MEKEKNNSLTEEWQLYEKGKSYNLMVGLFEDTERNYNFYHGKQWDNARLGNIQPITLNVIRPTVKYKVGVLNSNDYQIVFNPNVYDTKQQGEDLEDLCKSLNRYSNRVWEQEQVNTKVKEVVKDACINSEGICHSYEEDEEIKVEVIDKTNMFLGNENDSDLQAQPYILLSFRRTVDSVKEEARKNGISEDEIANITADSDYEEQAGRDKRIEEVSPMCLVLLKYYKKDGTVWIKKSTKNVVIKQDADTKLTLYPIAHMVWEDVKGYSRGEGEVKYLIPNQIEINKTATRRAIAVQMCAYPKLVANMKYITNPSSLNKVGTTIELSEMQADDVNKVVSYLRPTSMTSDAVNLQQELMKDTQELAGAGDTVNGNVDPTQTSGKAILAVQQAGQQPLNEQLDKFKTFLEDLARIWYEMLQTYSVEGIVVTKEEKNIETGETTEIPYQITYEQLQAMKPDLKIDITPHSAYDKYAQEQSLENLFTSGAITFEEYVNALSDDSVMPKPILTKILQQRKEAQQKIHEMEMQANALDGAMKQEMSMQEMQNNDNEINNIQQQADIVNQNAMSKIGG